MKKTIKGNGKPVIGIIGCLHGNEKIGKEVTDLLKAVPLKKGTIVFILANEEAMRQDKRYINADLNRVFPGREDGNHEEKLASALQKELSECDYVIDIHSTTADTENLLIITKDGQGIRALVDSIPLKNVVFMEPIVAKGKSLIDNVRCGVSIEFNLNTPAREVKEIIVYFLRNLGLLDGYAKKICKETYSVYGLIEKNEQNKLLQLINLQMTELGGEVFYPIFFGEKEYPNLLCMKAKRVSIFQHIKKIIGRNKK